MFVMLSELSIQMGAICLKWSVSTLIIEIPAFILAASMILEHLDMADKAEQIRQAIRGTLLAKDRLTGDLGGSAKTSEFTDAVIERLSA